MEITKDIQYVGVNDHQIDLFEGQYVVENGMAYNSYMIMDEKIAVCDTVDAHFTEEWLGNINAVLDGKKPDYLIVHHMEPDHSASIDALDVYKRQVINQPMAEVASFFRWHNFPQCHLYFLRIFQIIHQPDSVGQALSLIHIFFPISGRPFRIT